MASLTQQVTALQRQLADVTYSVEAARREAGEARAREEGAARRLSVVEQQISTSSSQVVQAAEAARMEAMAVKAELATLEAKVDAANMPNGAWQMGQTGTAPYMAWQMGQPGTGQPGMAPNGAWQMGQTGTAPYMAWETGHPGMGQPGIAPNGAWQM